MAELRVRREALTGVDEPNPDVGPLGRPVAVLLWAVVASLRF
jgi:hypothetical protein